MSPHYILPYIFLVGVIIATNAAICCTVDLCCILEFCVGEDSGGVTTTAMVFQGVALYQLGPFKRVERKGLVHTGCASIVFSIYNTVNSTVN